MTPRYTASRLTRMISPFCRNVTAKIVVPRPNTVNVFCGKRQKFTPALPTDHTPRQTRAAGSGELFDHLVGAVAVVASVGLFRQFGHLSRANLSQRRKV